MNKKLVFAALCVAAFGSSVKADGKCDKVKNFFVSVCDAPGNVVFKDGSWLEQRTHKNVPFVSRVALTLYAIGGTAALSPKALKKRLAKLAFCCKKK